MDALFASGRVVDAVLVGVGVEALVLAWIVRRLGRGPDLPALAANLAAGAALMLALRAALIGAPWPVVATWMLAGLCAHLADLALRLTRTGRYVASGAGPGEGALPEPAGAPGVHADGRLERL